MLVSFYLKYYNYEINTSTAGANGNNNAGSFTDAADNSINCVADKRIQIDNYNPKCETSACGVGAYNSCRNSACGVESYNYCEHSQCGVKYHNACWHYGKTCSCNSGSH